MANYANLLATIAANIYTNGNNEVTAAMVKAAVDAMVNSLGAGYQFMGVATPATDPGTPDVKQYYIASTPGTYTDFLDSGSNPLEVQDGEVAILYGSGAVWSKLVTGAANKRDVDILKQDVFYVTSSDVSDYNSFARVPFIIKTGDVITFTPLNASPTSLMIGENGTNLFPGGLTQDVPVTITSDRDAEFFKCWVGSVGFDFQARIELHGNIESRISRIGDEISVIGDVGYTGNGTASISEPSDYNYFARLPFKIKNGVPFVFTPLNHFVYSVILGENGSNLFPGGVNIGYPVNITPDRDADFIKCWVGESGFKLTAKIEAVDSMNRRTDNTYIEKTINITDYGSNLVTALAAISPSKHVHYIINIPEGEYDVESWFPGIQPGEVGLTIPSFVKLKGVGLRDKVILKWDNSGGTFNNDVSTINTIGEWHEFENLTIVANNVRYAVHDDNHSPLLRYMACKNCKFVSTIGTRAWGAGTDNAYMGIFEDCSFLVELDPDHLFPGSLYDAFLLHDYSGASGTISRVIFRNCRFQNDVHEGNSTDVGFGFANGNCNIILEGCKTGVESLVISNKCMASGFANIFGADPSVTNPQAGVDYFDFI